MTISISTIIKKRMSLALPLMEFLAITTTASTFYLATSGSVCLGFSVTFCIEWQ